MFPIFLRQTLLDKQIAIETKSNAIIKRCNYQKKKSGRKTIRFELFKKNTQKLIQEKHNKNVKML